MLVCLSAMYLAMGLPLIPLGVHIFRTLMSVVVCMLDCRFVSIHVYVSKCAFVPLHVCTCAFMYLCLCILCGTLCMHLCLYPVELAY